MDLRTQKIYRALIAACQQLLTEKPFEKITVAELCTRAQTRRATFYKHFADKYDFLAFMITTIRADIINKTDPQGASPVADYHALIDSGLTFVESHRQLLLALDSSPAARGVIMTLSEQPKAGNQQALAILPAGLQDELAVQFLTGALNQCIRWWLHHPQMSKGAVQKRLNQLCDQFLTATH